MEAVWLSPGDQINQAGRGSAVEGEGMKPYGLSMYQWSKVIKYIYLNTVRK